MSRNWSKTIVLDMYDFHGSLPGGDQRDDRFTPYIIGLVHKSGAAIHINSTAQLYRLSESDGRTRLYICGHGSPDDLAGMSAEQLAKFLTDNGLSEVGYICLTGCESGFLHDSYAEKLWMELFKSQKHIVTAVSGRTGYLTFNLDGSKEVEIDGPSGVEKIPKGTNKNLWGDLPAGV